MARGEIIYANNHEQICLNSKITNELSDLFDVIFAGELCPDLIERLKVYPSKFGFLTHFPYSMTGPGNNLYGGAVEMIGNLREDNPDLPIVVYTGAGCSMASPSDEMRNMIIGAGASHVVFKYDVDGEIQEIRDKFLELMK